MRNPSRRNLSRRTLMALAGLLLTLGTGLFFALRYDTHLVGTEAMGPTFEGDDQVLVDTAGAHGADLRHGDVVVVRGDWPGAPDGYRYTVRVIGLGGERVQGTRDGSVTVNGTRLDEPYAHGDHSAYGAFDITVPTGRVFLLADARSIAVDSRAYLSTRSGTLPADAIEGRVAATAWPVWGLATDPSTSSRLPLPAMAGAGTAAGVVLLALAARPWFTQLRSRVRSLRPGVRERTT
ncbi:signal peptidase I [Streptomyces sp. NBC_01465]|uniref:signal peptidase I n=1 Tax=Streptomyces sp. NBC_01465 TaxID=2903878 RepID=UPI002E35F4CE|nr:signal peptidase I [Streptomyces sp. NBC_01465]